MQHTEYTKSGEYSETEEVVHDVVIKRSGYDGKIKVENIPPSEFLISREAKSIQEARFV